MKKTVRLVHLIRIVLPEARLFERLSPEAGRGENAIPVVLFSMGRRAHVLSRVGLAERCLIFRSRGNQPEEFMKRPSVRFSTPHTKKCGGLFYLLLQDPDFSGLCYY